MKGMWSRMVEAGARVIGFASTTAPKSEAAKPGARRDIRVLAPVVRHLASEGATRSEIARRTGISQDIVGMLLNLPPAEAAESAGSGTFFRILKTRMGSEQAA